MIPGTWSINAIATELGVDRRRVARALRDATPCGEGAKGPLFRLLDAVHELFGYTGSDNSVSAWLYVDQLEDEGGLQDFAAQLGGADAPRVLRALREFLATQTWAYTRTPGVEPEPPSWAGLSDEEFERAYLELRTGASYEDVAEFVASASEGKAAPRRRNPRGAA
jgi:hypothetical protein